MPPAGQAVTATVVSVRNTAVQIRIGDALIAARTDLPVSAGDVLRLRVESAGARTLLRVIGDDHRTLVTQGLRVAIAQQQDLKTVFDALVRLRASSGQQLPTEIRSALDTLLARTPSLRQLFDASELAGRLTRSGLFMEASLMRHGGEGVSSDLKALLLRLLALIKRATEGGEPGAGGDRARLPDAPLLQLLGALAKQTQGALARIQLHQLAQFTAEGENPAWSFELPLRTDQEYASVKLRFTCEADHSADPERPWSVTLTMTDQEGAPLRAVISLRGGAISTAFWSGRTETAQSLAERLPELRARLEAQGLEVGRLGSYPGEGGTEDEPPPWSPGNLFRGKA